MYVLTVTTTRPDISVEFYWNNPTIWPGPATYIGLYFTSGDIILPIDRIFSADTLTFTRTITFKDPTSAITYFTGLDTDYPTWITEKNNYDTLNGHTETKVYTTV